MNEIFDMCVTLLEITCKWFGLTYKEWNVILFVIIQPAVILLLCVTCIWLSIRCYLYKRKLKAF